MWKQRSSFIKLAQKVSPFVCVCVRACVFLNETWIRSVRVCVCFNFKEMSYLH